MQNCTLIKDDLRESGLAESIKTLSKTARGLFWQGVPFAHHGILRNRWRLNKWHDQWEYAKVLSEITWERNWNVVDFGGAASLPVYHMALEGCTVTTIDQDPELVEATRKFSEEKSLALAVVDRSLAHENVDGQGESDWVFAHSVLESYARDEQIALCQKLAGFLKKGGLLTLTFQYGEGALLPHAPHTLKDIEEWVSATGLHYYGNESFVDREERYALDGRRPDREFTLGSLFLQK